MVTFPVTEDTLCQTCCSLIDINRNQIVCSCSTLINGLIFQQILCLRLKLLLSRLICQRSLNLLLDCCRLIFSHKINKNCLRILLDSSRILRHICINCSRNILFCRIRILNFKYLFIGTLDSILICCLTRTCLYLGIKLIMELLFDYRLILSFHCRIDIIIVLMLLRLFRFHNRILRIHLVHDIRHIKAAVL